MITVTEQRAPTGDFLTTNWGKYPSYASSFSSCVDDAIASYDDDTTYVYTNTTGTLTVLFSYTSFSVPNNAVEISLDIKIRSRQSPSSPVISINSAIQISSSVYAKTASNTNTTYSTYSFTYATDPSTSAGWTPSGINGVSYFGAIATPSSLAQMLITQIYAEVTYKVDAPFCMAGPGVVVASKSVSAG